MLKEPKQPKCLQCKRNRSGSFAVICGGAMLMDRSRRNGGPHNSLDAYWDITWHGAHDSQKGAYRDIYEQVSIISDLRGGQFELQFCTTRCLRRFLNSKVDELEAKREKEERRKKKKKNR